ncbi:hypothetical protein CC78DRAFT_463108, partial [Lojkania enalia]
RVSRVFFKGSKTAFAHLIYNNSKLLSLPLVINREEIAPIYKVKILGVILD